MQKGHRRLAVFRLGALTGSLLTHLQSIEDAIYFVIPSIKKMWFLRNRPLFRLCNLNPLLTASNRSVNLPGQLPYI